MTGRPPSPATTVLIRVGVPASAVAHVGGHDAAGAGREGALEHDDVIGTGSASRTRRGGERPVHREPDDADGAVRSPSTTSSTVPSTEPSVTTTVRAVPRPVARTAASRRPVRAA